MTDRRWALFKPLGLLHWQLRRPELLAVQGSLPDRGLGDATPAEGRTLWLVGPAPAWLADFRRLLPSLSCQTWSPEATPGTRDLLLVLEHEPSSLAWRDQPFACCLDATQGKRALWLQVCAAGLVGEWARG